MSDPAQTPPDPAPVSAPHQAEPTDADLRSEAAPPGWVPAVWKRFRTTAIENAALRQQVTELAPTKAEAQAWKERHANDSQGWNFERAYYQAGFNDPEGLEVARALWNAKPAEQRTDPVAFLATPPKALSVYKASAAPGQAAAPAPPAPPPPNPNGGAGQPAGAPGAQKWTAEAIAKVRAANGGRLPAHVLAELQQDPGVGIKNLPKRGA